MEELKTKRIHRVGAITTGVSLVAVGVLCLLHMTMGLSYTMIFKFWPIVLIGMGLEMLIANTFDWELKYDGGAIALLFFLFIFAVTMAGLQVGLTELNVTPWNGNITISPNF